MSKSAKQNQKASRITPGRKWPQREPKRLHRSPISQMPIKMGEIPSDDFRRHCSMSCGSSRTIQHPSDVDDEIPERATLRLLGCC